MEYFRWLLDRPDNHSILMVRYEDLQANVVSEVKRILDFLSFSVEGKLEFVVIAICLKLYG